MAQAAPVAEKAPPLKKYLHEAFWVRVARLFLKSARDDEGFCRAKFIFRREKLVLKLTKKNSPPETLPPHPRTSYGVSRFACKFPSGNVPRPVVVEVIESSARKLGSHSIFIEGKNASKADQYILHFAKTSTCERAADILEAYRARKRKQFRPFEHYDYLFNQLVHLNEKNRLKAFREAILGNPSDFQQKTVLVIGCSLGILGFFAAEAGANEVYVVDPADVSAHVEMLLRANTHLASHKIKHYQARVEAVELPGKVDTIVCDSFGDMMLNGQMLRSLIIARDRFLIPGGKIFPSHGTLLMRPIREEILDGNFYRICNNIRRRGGGLLSPDHLEHRLSWEYHGRPELLQRQQPPSSPTCHEETFDFKSITAESLRLISFHYNSDGSKDIQGFEFSFKLVFNGSENYTVFNTEYEGQPTRWLNVLCRSDPIGTVAHGRQPETCDLLANEHHSYDIRIFTEPEVKQFGLTMKFGSSIVQKI
ncbi:protein arginine N-methyltransferase 6 [Galendromus occidentalis]|uniref:Protein arginine N-methyltransferase 6 n=1 Tax=Galendromus occidentalis TaxID=34638 RepID=A0AAJ6QMX5_9ACAR|nr:protein arginine N-methyltransferase 6 [Galendromus occidentalis]